MYKTVMISLTTVALTLLATCGETRAQSFGDAFSDILESTQNCVCQPTPSDLATVERFLTNLAQSLDQKWGTGALPPDVDEEAPEFTIAYDKGKWSVRCDPRKADLPRYRFVMQLAEHELQQGQLPPDITFKAFVTFEIVDNYVETNVDANLMRKGEDPQHWQSVVSRPVLSSQRDVDFGPYMRHLQRRIRASWNPPKFSKSNRVQCVFRVQSDGTVSIIRLLGSSGTEELDHAAIDAIKNAGPFAKLPDGAPPDVDIQYTFDYNAVTHHCRVRKPVYDVTISGSEISLSRRDALIQAPHNREYRRPEPPIPIGRSL